MTAAAAPPDAPGVARAVLADLRRARRDRRTANFEFFEALYRVYITGILATVAVWLLSGLVGDTAVSAAGAHHVAVHGPVDVGVAVAVVWAVGLRSGGRGGPLVIEAADVRHVLLSPVDRAVALRGPALRQLRFGAAAGAGVGAAVGLLAYRRLPGGAPAWIGVGAAVGLIVVVGALGAAMVVSGLRLGPRLATVLAAAVVAWSCVDLATGRVTSPAGDVGALAVAPLHFRVSALIGVAVAVAAVGVGWRVVGGASIEAAERRASLVGQIRFAATLRDLRTVVVLRRQLAQELPRQRPWFRLGRAVAPPAASLPPGARTPRAKPRPFPVWRRGWHGILRFPAVRLARLVVAGGVAGAAMVGVWRGTTPLLLVAALALYVAALDVVEPISQELDHPDRRDSYAIEEGALMLRSMGPPVVIMVAVCVVGGGVAVALTRTALAVELAAWLVVPAALCAVAGAAVSVIGGAPAAFSATDSVLPPEVAGVKAIVRTLLPPVIVVAGVAPLLGGRHPGRGVSPLVGVAALVPWVVILVAAVGVWVRKKQAMMAWWRNAMEEASAARRPPPAAPAGRSRSGRE